MYILAFVENIFCYVIVHSRFSEKFHLSLKEAMQGLKVGEPLKNVEETRHSDKTITSIHISR